MQTEKQKKCSEYMRNYYHNNLKYRNYVKNHCKTEKYKKYKKQYYQSEKGKKMKAQDDARYYEKHKEKILKQVKKYSHSKRGKLTSAKHANIRHRKLGFNLKYCGILDEKCEYHHINNIDVAEIPRDLHRIYQGKNHREMLLPIIKQLYGDL